ncbi:MAG: protein Tex, partial [Actinoplanes sp.]|nr:protein Tex [Actinoplanes sp.]
KTVIGNSPLLRGLRPETFVTDTFGLPTISDILKELEKPGRDPRPAFTTATFAEGVEKLGDLTPGMILEGVVTNVAAFGAFVDIGVHQDGLVHVSALSNTFVKDPREVVKSGDVVKVRVIEVDAVRKRISLTMRLDDKPAQPRPERPAGGQERGSHGGGPRDQQRQGGSGQQRGQQPQGGGGQGGQQRQGGKRQGGGQGGGGQGGGGQGGQRQGQGGQPRQGDGGPRGAQQTGSIANSAMADALRRAGLTKD